MLKTKSRPVSPHLSVYKMQLNSLMSIIHRVTGLLLFFGLLLLLWWMIYCVHIYGYSTYTSFSITSFVMEMHDSTFNSIFSSMLGQAILILWSYCLFYHLSAGIRHLVWDAGHGFDIKDARRSGIFTLVVSVAMWGLAWIFILV